MTPKAADRLVRIGPGVFVSMAVIFGLSIPLQIVMLVIRLDEGAPAAAIWLTVGLMAFMAGGCVVAIVNAVRARRATRERLAAQAARVHGGAAPPTER